MNLRKSVKVSGILLILVILFYLMNYGFSFPPCSSYEIPLSVPSPMKMNDIVFQEQVYSITKPYKESKSFYEFCPNNIREDAVGYINLDNRLHDTSGYVITPIEKDARFKFIRRAEIKYRGISDFEGGKSSDYLLVQDEKGRNWYIRASSFLDYYDEKGNYRDPKYTAAYYNNGQKIGDVILKEI